MVCDVSIMRYAHNDNANTWISLAAATARLLQTKNEEVEKQSGKPEPGRENHHGNDADPAYVEQRLREIEAFERRACGGKR